MYKIIRYYYVSGRRKVVGRHKALKEAQTHCSKAGTKRDGAWFDGHKALKEAQTHCSKAGTKRDGAWFDGYVEERGEG